MTPIFRPAQKTECKTIAKLYSISSDGIADYIWTKLAQANEDIIDVGAQRYQQENSSFSYRNCTVVEVAGKVVGMLVAFPMYSPDSDESLAGQELDPVLAPYNKLEEYESYYICGVALFDNYRCLGLGRKLMQLAEQKCRDLQLSKLSLIVFEQNTGAKRLYETLGYKIVLAEKVVPHPLIHYTGKALLMVKHL